VATSLARETAERVRARWGNGKGELGRKKDPESAPEGPMSFAASGKELWVLDQVNGRIVAGDRVLAIEGETAQDLAVKDGKAFVLDRLGKKEVDLYGDASGHLPLVGGPVHEGGEVTGLFVDDGGVYVEREHTDLVRIGGLDGTPDPDRPVLPGRPVRGGTDVFLRASIVARGQPGVSVWAVARDGTTLWQRGVALPHGVVHLSLLDSDRVGHVFLGALVADEGVAPPYALTNAQTVVVRLAAADGSDAGLITLPVAAGPEESFRELAVTDDGEVLQMLPGPDGVTITAYSFP
jgi:hypothetical protein